VKHFARSTYGREQSHTERAATLHKFAAIHRIVGTMCLSGGGLAILHTANQDSLNGNILPAFVIGTGIYGLGNARTFDQSAETYTAAALAKENI